MSEGAWIVLVVVVSCLLFGAAGAGAGFHYGVVSTTSLSQREAVKAGAAKWAADKETGDPVFTWARCDALGVTR